MKGALSVWVRADWRRRRSALIALALLAGLAFGVVATVVAGARRTASSFERMRTETRAYDNGIVIDTPGASPGHPELDRYDHTTVERIRALREIESAGEMVVYSAGLADADWEFTVYAPADGVIGSEVLRARPLRGRLPRADRVDEVAVNEAAAALAHLDVGSEVELVTLSPAQRLQIINGDPDAFDHGLLGPILHLHVVGVVRGTADVVGRQDPDMLATVAFDRAHRDDVAYSSRVLLVRRAPSVSAAALDDRLREVSDGYLGDFDAATEDKAARQAVRTLALGLTAFALFAGVATLLAVNHGAARHVAAADRDQLSLAAIGLTRAERAGAVVATVAPAAVGGALLAVLSSTAASSIMPVGLAHRIEPDVGVRFDPLVAAGTAATVLVVVLVSALLTAIPATRLRRPQQAVGRGSAVARALGFAGAGPVATTGARLAFDRRPPALPVRSALLGMTTAVIVIIGSITFASSLDRLEREPLRWGFGWDLMLDSSEASEHTMPGELAADEDLAGVGVLSGSYTLLRDGAAIRAYGLDPVRGDIGYALQSGRQPVGADEVVIGPATSRAWHIGVGDRLDVARCPCSGEASTTALAPVRVVGIALFPEDDSGNFSDALGFAGPGFAHHVGDETTPRMAVQIAPGRSLATVARDLGRRYPGQVSAYSYPSRPGEVANLDELRRFPSFLAGLTALLGVVALANMLVTTLHRRRRELATLRSLGLSPRRTGWCLTIQSLSVSAVAVGIGVPVGSLAGAAVWQATTRDLGVATDASRPAWSIVLVVVAAGSLAAAIGAHVGWRAAHLSPAAALRAE